MCEALQEDKLMYITKTMMLIALPSFLVIKNSNTVAQKLLKALEIDCILAEKPETDSGLLNLQQKSEPSFSCLTQNRMQLRCCLIRLA